MPRWFRPRPSTAPWRRPEARPSWRGFLLRWPCRRDRPRPCGTRRRRQLPPARFGLELHLGVMGEFVLERIFAIFKSVHQAVSPGKSGLSPHMALAPMCRKVELPPIRRGCATFQPPDTCNHFTNLSSKGFRMALFSRLRGKSKPPQQDIVARGVLAPSVFVMTVDGSLDRSELV